MQLGAGDPVPTLIGDFEYQSNINTSKSLQKSKKQFANRQKWFPPLEPDSCLGYTSILLYLLS